MEELNRKEFKEIKIILLIGISILLFLGLYSYDQNDISFNTSSPNIPPHNFVGVVGAWGAMLSFFLFGLSSFIIPFITLSWAVNLIFQEKIKISNLFYLVLLLFSISTLLELLPIDYLQNQAKQINILSAGGLFSYKITSTYLLRYLGDKGSYALISALLIISFLKAANLHIVRILQTLIKLIKNLFSSAETEDTISYEQKFKKPDRSDSKEAVKKKKIVEKISREKTEKPPAKKTFSFSGSSAKSLPDINYLDDPPKFKDTTDEELLVNAQILEETLKDFGIDSKVINIGKGPVITRFELQIAAGTKVTKITALADDIAMAMKAFSIRIIAPIPGKAAIGIEVPNKEANMVYLKELLLSKEYKQSNWKIPLLFGKDIAGKPLIEDLTEMPHLLIAGSTGSGKTICINALIMGLLFSKTPNEIKLLLIDPKMVELTPYKKLPHLICPIITEPKKAVLALNFLVREMEHRYKLLSEVGQRNIFKFNDRNPKNDPEGEEIPEKLPFIIVVIDELADLMMVASSDIETSIARLAQLSRAVGIHLILATQRPSVDVLTGIIKANFPARLSFKVSSKVDSRTILDANGAEKLLGCGDLLFLPPKTSKLIRAQGTFVSDSNINNVVKSIAKERPAEYNETFLRLMDNEETEQYNLDFEEDELFDSAVNLVFEAGQASASMLQRRFRIGYNRASRIIDMMEAQGIIGPFNGSRVREVLTKKQK